MANKTKVIHVAVEPSLYKALKKLADAWMCSVSHVIRYAVNDYVSKERNS